jgi:hypothetical protein
MTKIKHNHDAMWATLAKRGSVYRRMLKMMKTGMSEVAHPGLSQLISTMDLVLERM